MDLGSSPFLFENRPLVIARNEAIANYTRLLCMCAIASSYLLAMTGFYAAFYNQRIIKIL